ncbi:MAG: class I SAM-dependent methyltransferase [Calditrichota bacterium]
MQVEYLYDLFYPSVRGLTYDQEAALFHEMIRRHQPDAMQILDIACGTGGHAAALSKYYNIIGVDCDKASLDRARKRISSASFYEGDMMDFELSSTFDVILCLGSSIGFAQTLKCLHTTLNNFRKHIAANGLLILEPWMTPEHWESGKMDVHTFKTTSLSITRMTHYGMDEGLSQLTHDYIIERHGETERVKEQYKLGLFRYIEIEEALASVDFQIIGIEEFTDGRQVILSRAI